MRVQRRGLERCLVVTDAGRAYLHARSNALRLGFGEEIAERQAWAAVRLVSEGTRAREGRTVALLFEPAREASVA